MANKKQEILTEEKIILDLSTDDFEALLSMAETGVKAAIMQLLGQPDAIRNINQTTSEALRIIDAAKIKKD